jgi:hypothetical protein
MEAYLLAQEKASERLDQAATKREKAYEDFAARNTVKIVAGSANKTTQKLEKTASVMTYYHQVYLIFFKSNKQEAYTVKAMNDKNINGVEQNRETLSKYSTEGLTKLASIQPFENDNSLTTACRKALEFYKTEADSKIPGMTDYLIRSQDFEKLKKTFEAKPASRRTEAEVKDYNKKVNELNTAGQAYNKTNQELNSQQKKVVDNWNSSVKDFIDKHVPK